MVTGTNAFRISLTMLAAIAASHLAGCSNDPEPPKGFGINVTVNARNVPASERSRIVSGRILASMGPTSTVDIDKAIDSGEVRFRYVPQAMDGVLTLAMEALDAAGVVVASGLGEPVAITPGRAAAVTITLAPGALPGGGDGGVFDFDAAGGNGKPIGDRCATNAECSTNFCADGFCCNAACKGTCESCATPGREGFCDAYAAETDPELECVAVVAMSPPSADAGAADDAGTPDGGAELNIPDGGLMRNSTVCGGKCDGNRACKYPGPTTTCGTKWCNEPSEPAAMVCNGAGSCEPAVSKCMDYACNDGACLSRCTKHEDCQTATTYCTANNTCNPKKGNGIGCTLPNECQSGHCSGGVCCNTACNAPLSCTQTPGSCKCPGVTCNAGVACQVFYRDADVDGYGDATGTLGNGNAAPACAGMPPAGFVANNGDCDDADANVHPGQAAFFDTPSKGKGTYDYNCDGQLTKGDFDGLGSSCLFQYGEECGTSVSGTCKTAGEKAGNACVLSCGVIIREPVTFATIGIIPIRRCYPDERDGFTTTVGCGVSGTYRTCGTCSAAGQAPAAPANSSRKQRCN